MIFPTPPPTNELPPAVLEQDIRNWRINTPFAGDGYAPSLRSFSNLGNTRTESIHNWERERLLRQIKAETDAGKNRVMRLFENRLEADRAFLEGIETSKITAYCSNSVEVMAAFLPTRLSADVSPDASIVVQAFYGDALRVFWETFFDAEEDVAYSTLNITLHKKVVISEGGQFDEVKKRFVELLSPLFKVIFPYL